MRSRIHRFAFYAWVVLAYNILVILWGAFVRASGSGAGCGSHWPLCNGVVIPRADQVETIIEFTHRMMSGLALIFIFVMVIWAFRLYPKGSQVRIGVTLSGVFIITEALVGAGLVLFEWVANDASLGRVISQGVHLVNTFLLLASLTLTAWWASEGGSIQVKGQGILLAGILIGLVGGLILGVSGAITALGDTLFPVSSLAEGIRQDLSPTAHFLIRLRVWHPLIAILVGFYLIFFSVLAALFRSSPANRKLAIAVSAIVVCQLIAGLINLLLLAPTWMQILHLLLADILWIAFVLFSASVVSSTNPQFVVQSGQSSQAAIITS